VSALGDAIAPVDGRVARRQRNIDTVLGVVLELFAEDAMFPSMEQAANRSGLSLRSLYRYFADPGELREAAIRHNREIAATLAHLHAIGEGPLDERIEAFVAMRIRLYDGVAAVYRATMANAMALERVREERAHNRDLLREQFAVHFAPELDALDPERRSALLDAGDLLTQLDAIDFLRDHRCLSAGETQRVLGEGLRALLG